MGIMNMGKKDNEVVQPTIPLRDEMAEIVAPFMTGLPLELEHLREINERLSDQLERLLQAPAKGNDQYPDWTLGKFFVTTKGGKRMCTKCDEYMEPREPRVVCYLEHGEPPAYSLHMACNEVKPPKLKMSQDGNMHGLTWRSLGLAL